MNMATYLPDPAPRITNNVIQWETNKALLDDGDFNLIKVHEPQYHMDCANDYLDKYDLAFTWMRLKGIKMSSLFTILEDEHIIKIGEDHV